MKENSREENIKILEEHAQFYLNDEDRQSLQNLIEAYKELEEENKISKNMTSQLMADFINRNVIPVSLVEEKIEEIDKIYKGIPEDEGNFAKAILIKEKQLLQELLEKR